MKTIILHGDDIQKSYLRLEKFIETARSRSWEVIFIDEGSANFEEILSGTSLFGGERFFILRDPKKLGKADLTWLGKKSAGLTGNLIIYNEGTLNVTLLKNFPKDTEVEEFKLPVLIWNFLDGLVPGNSSNSIKTLHKIIEKEAPEFIFSLIARHFRDLYWTRFDLVSTGFPSWKMGKLKSQASKFSAEELPKFISALADIDIQVKTSKADLVSALDLLMIKQLE